MTALRTETPPLLSDLYTDRYELSMAWLYWREGRADVPAVFDYFFRTLPFGGGDWRQRFQPTRLRLSVQLLYWVGGNSRHEDRKPVAASAQTG